MIKKESIEINWINKVSLANKNADKILIEKVIRSLLLVEGLKKQNIDFVFKGGTALMLLLDTPRRLSIDTDIILSSEINEFEGLLKNVVNEQFFSRFELQERKTDSKIKKAHYKVFYSPTHRTQTEEEYVLLDILFEKVQYKKVTAIPISSPFLQTEGTPITVTVPSLEDILGDKLTAFAPNTTGIPYFKKGNSMSMEIIKQLYDIGNLADVIEDIEIVKSTFLVFAKTELAYRKMEDLSEKDVLEDIIQTALHIISRGNAGKGNFNELLGGIRRISRYIFSETFHLEKAIVLASKAAYLAALIKYDIKSIEKYDNPSQINDWNIDNPLWSRINRLKKSNPPAFFYWYKIHQIIK